MTEQRRWWLYSAIGDLRNGVEPPDWWFYSAVRDLRAAERSVTKPKPKYPVRTERPVHKFGLKRLGHEESWIKLITLEYDKAADRYENIYRAIWQHFSYMAVLSAAILTFGAKEFELPFLTFVALSPQVFWFLATFIPMDVYGERTRRRLAEIEVEINDVYFPNIDDPKLSHFIDFKEKRKDETLTPVWRVKTAVRIFGWSVLLICLGGLAIAVKKGEYIKSVEPSAATSTTSGDSTSVTIRQPEQGAVRDSLQSLSRRINHVDSIVITAVSKLDSLRLAVNKTPTK